MSDVLWQIALTDALLICLVASIGWWFRMWLSRERNELQRQLETLQKQQQNLEQVCNRLEAVSRSFERMGRRRVEERVENRLTNGKEPEEVYARALERLERGHAATAVAKELGMGTAEVELLGRMMRLRRQR